MKGRKNGENGKKIRRVIRLTLHNTKLHITFSFTFTNRQGSNINSDEKTSDRSRNIFQPQT